MLGQLKQIFLTPEAFGNMLMSELQAHEKAPLTLAEQRRDVVAQVAGLDAELTHLADAIAGGAAPQALVAAMTAREAERRALQARLEHLDGLAIEAGQPFDLNA